MDLIVRQVRTMGAEGLFEIGVEDGSIAKFSRAIEEKGEREIDAEGGLVLPTFVEPHVHFDKVLLAERVREASSISEARQAVKEAKRNFTLDDVRGRVERVIPWALQSGVTAIRTHVDVDGTVNLTSVEALLSLKKKYRDLLELQVVAFPQEGLVQDGQSLELLRKAIEIGADVVGGLPEAERSSEDSRKHIDLVSGLAKEMGCDIDVHCDVLPSARMIDYYATQISRLGLQERATADHLIALSYYGDKEAVATIDHIRQASLNVIVNPCTMMTSGATISPPIGRGVTRIKELMKAGVNLAYGTDNIVDPYNPFGDFDPLSNGWLLAYQGQLNTTTEIESILRMPTYNSARILRLQRYGLQVGNRADFNIFGAASVGEALRTHAKPRYAVKKGKIIAENIMEAIHHFA